MKRSDWISGPHGVRPNGKPTECFYCNAPVGEEHSVGCVIRSRTVVVRTTIEHVVVVPEDWDTSLIEFARNESSSCTDNIFVELDELTGRLNKADICSCGMVDTTYVREATAEDEERSILFVKDCLS